MSSIGNKEIFAKNLRYYLDHSGKTQKEIAAIVDVAQSTFNDWATGKKYPRIDKIEILANYFGILKSDLIEEKVTDEQKAGNEALAGIIVRLRRDAVFRQIVENLNTLDAEKLQGVQQMLNAFVK